MIVWPVSSRFDKTNGKLPQQQWLQLTLFGWRYDLLVEDFTVSAALVVASKGMRKLAIEFVLDISDVILKLAALGFSGQQNERRGGWISQEKGLVRPKIQNERGFITV